MRIFFSMLLFLSTLQLFAEPQNFAKIYDQGIYSIENGQPAEARAKFQQVLKSPADMGLQDNAEYWIAVSYFDEGRFDEAILHYRKAQDLPDGNKAGAAQYELALSYLKMGDTTHAAAEFYKVVSMYPSEGLAEKTFAKLDSLKSVIQANIPTRGPMTPGLAGNAIAPQTSAQTRPNNANVPQTGPLAGAELPVAKRVIPSEQPATQPAQATQAKPETSQAKINQPAQTAPAPAQKPVQQNAQPAKTVAPANDDPRSLIRPEDKRGI